MQHEHNLLKKNKLTISGDDIKEGLLVLLSAKIPDPKFSSQTKDKLVSSEVRMIVESIVNEKLSIWFDQNPTTAKIILAKSNTSCPGKRCCKKGKRECKKKRRIRIKWATRKIS